MRPDVLEFARDVAENFAIAEPLVEMGARAAEGQEDIADVRPIFGAGTHIGCDIQEGLGVDRIEDIHHLTFDDDSVGTVICLETLEHVADPLRAVQEMHRVLRPGGVLAISSLMFFPIHAHPWDYWRFTPEGFDLLLQPVRVPAGGRRRPRAAARGRVRHRRQGPGARPRASPPARGPSERRETGREDSIVDFGVVRMTVRDALGATRSATACRPRSAGPVGFAGALSPPVGAIATRILRR